MQQFNLTGYTKTVAKLLIDRVLFAPPFLVLTIAFLQWTQHFSVTRTIEQIRHTYWPVLRLNEQLWTVAQIVNFELVPVEYQVLFGNAVALGWNMLLSLNN